MRIGFNLPQIGPAASPEAVVRVAKQVEDGGFDSIWVTDRVLFPMQPQTPYAWTPDQSFPDVYKIVLDPVEALVFASAHTSRVALGTSVLDMPFYNPVMLARRLTTLDVLSNGRLRVGFGLGWSKDEYDAAGAEMRQRGDKFDEFLQLLKTIWTTNPAEFHGRFYELPISHIEPKPVQKPHPPIYLAAYSERGLKRVGAMANGWNPVGVPVDGMVQMMGVIKDAAKEAGRNPDEIELVVRANVILSGEPLGDDRWIYTGSDEQVKADIAATRDIGADEIFFDPTFSSHGTSVGGFLEVIERIGRMV